MRRIEFGFKDLRVRLQVPLNPKHIAMARWLRYPCSTHKTVIEEDVAVFCNTCDRQGSENQCTRQSRRAQGEVVLKKRCPVAVIADVKGILTPNEFTPYMTASGIEIIEGISAK
jgi:hypothetical protein